MQSQRSMSALAACCRIWGAGWERLHLGRTRGSCSPPFMHHPPGSYRQRVPSPVAPSSCQALGSNIKASADPQFSSQRPWWICTAIPQAQAPRSSPSSGFRESWSQDSICVPAHKGRGGGVQRRQKPNGQTAGGSEQSLVGKAGTAPGMGMVHGAAAAADTRCARLLS